MALELGHTISDICIVQIGKVSKYGRTSHLSRSNTAAQVNRAREQVLCDLLMMRAAHIIDDAHKQTSPWCVMALNNILDVTSLCGCNGFIKKNHTLLVIIAPQTRAMFAQDLLRTIMQTYVLRYT